MNRFMLAFILSAAAGAASAGNLCSNIPFSKMEAEQGKVAFDSHCAFCHQYNMTGREPGNYQKETPDISVLSPSDVKFLEGNGGAAPPLIGPKFFKKQAGKTLTEFANTTISAANTFPTKDFQPPKTYFLLAAYVLYRNCGKM